MARETIENFFERSDSKPGPQGGGRIEGNQFTFIQNGYAIGQEFDFRERVRGEKQGSALTRDDFRLQEAAKFSRSDGVQAAGGFIEQQDSGLVKEGAEKAEALNGTGRQSANLTAERGGKSKSFRESRDSGVQIRVREVVQTAKETEIFASGETRIETEVRAGVIAEVAADFRGFACGIKTGDNCGAAGGQQQRGQDAEKRGFASAIGAEQSYGLALLDLESDAEQGRSSGRGKRLSKGAPATMNGREPFFERINGDGRVGHSAVYSVSMERIQSGELRERQ